MHAAEQNDKIRKDRPVRSMKPLLLPKRQKQQTAEEIGACLLAADRTDGHNKLLVVNPRSLLFDDASEYQYQ